MDITNEKLLKQVIENVKSEVEKLEVIRQNISDELYRYDEASLANQNNETIFDELQQKTDESYIHVDESMQSLNNIVKNLGTTLELNEKIKASEKQYGKKK
ncbi:hypothetical protein GQR36_26955 [Enterococcus termitis]